jgi:hypothetical protein
VKSLYSTRYRQLLTLLIGARRSSGKSQQVVANELGRPQSSVSKYESGERRLAGWDGSVCAAPRLNGACLKLKLTFPP